MSELQTPHSHFELSHVKIYCLENCTDMIKHVGKTAAMHKAEVDL